MKTDGPHTYAVVAGGRSQAAQDLGADPARGRVLVARPVARRRVAVADVRVATGQPASNSRASAANGCWRCCGRRTPTRSPGGTCGRERVQHGQHRGGADAGRQQQHRSLVVAEREGPSWSRDVDRGAGMRVGAQEAAGRAVGFLLDADAVVPVAGRAGQRITADDRRGVDIGRSRTVRNCPGNASGSGAPSREVHRTENTSLLSS